MIPELTPLELLAGLESAAPPQVLDVRARERAAQGHIVAHDYHNVAGSELARFADPAQAGLDRGRPVAVVCDRGFSSRQVTAWLRRRGFEARSLAGGMQRWMLTAARREVRGIAGLDLLLQFDRFGKGALGHLAVAGAATSSSGTGREALAIDPGRDLEPWLAALAESDARLVGVVDTHCHADYLSGGPALAQATGAPYRIHPADARDPYERGSARAARFSFEPLSDGEQIVVGGARFVVEHLPGHTEGSVALRLGDELAFTGDLLFVASIGRPDLADRTAEWTEQLWASLVRIRREWPAELRVFPAHYGSEAERRADRVVAGRFGELLSHNVPLAISDVESFRRWVGERVGDAPEVYRRIKRANLGLVAVDEELADELEAGKSQCALTT